MVKTKEFFEACEREAREMREEDSFCTRKRAVEVLGGRFGVREDMVEDAIRGVEFASVVGIAEKWSLWGKLVGAEGEDGAVLIPPGLARYAAELCETRLELRGELSKGVYESVGMIRRKRQAAMDELTKGFCPVGYKDLLDASIMKDCTVLSTSIITNVALDAFLSFLELEIESQHSAVSRADFGEWSNAFKTNRDLEIGLQNTRFSYVTSSFNNEMFVFRTIDLNRASKLGDFSFCGNEKALEVLEEEFASVKRKALSAPSMSQISVNVWANMSKEQVESLFVKSTWPEFLFYAEGTSKLKRTPVFEFFCKTVLKLTENIIAALQRLARLSLQVGQKEEIPPNSPEARALESLRACQTLDEFISKTKQECSRVFGVPTLPLDKKKEKEMILAFKTLAKERSEKYQNKSALAALAVFSTFKVPIYYQDAMEDDVFDSVSRIVAFPNDLNALDWFLSIDETLSKCKKL